MGTQAAIAPDDFHVRHAELHHYTSMAGLEGIFRSQSLWATHFEKLNDRSEVTHFRKDLAAAIAGAAGPAIARLGRSDPRFHAETVRVGGLAARALHEAWLLVDSFYEVGFTRREKPPLAVPFIASFCSHAGDQQYEREHGLLSQWRGYGEDGGCCIVFDTPSFLELLQREWEAYHWVGITLDDVLYATKDIRVASQYPAIVSEFASILESHLIPGGQLRGPNNDAIATFLDAATIFKHQGFKEEREVRIVAIPGRIDASNSAKRARRKHTARPIKLVIDNPIENRARPYLALFDRLQAQLPINRIIVGPSRRQAENYEHVAAMMGDRYRIVRSQTPFVG